MPIEVYYWYERDWFAVPLNMSVPKKILIIEDDDVARELIGLALLRRGYQIALAEDGIRGYNSAVFLKPDLIIADISMPAGDGLELIARVRATPSLDGTPILVTTAFGSGRATFSLQHGANAYEPKPIDPHSFLATVDRLLAQSNTLAGRLACKLPSTRTAV
jgi:CheY-like chemotaxis protein